MLSSTRASPLPLYLRGKMAGQKRFSEFHCLLVLLGSFLFAWTILIAYMPKVQHSDITFEGMYSRFAPHRFKKDEMADETQPEVVPVSEDLSTDVGNQGSHLSVNREIDSKNYGSDYSEGTRKGEGPAEGDVPTDPAQVIAAGSDQSPSVMDGRTTSSNTASKNGSVSDQRRDKVREMIKHAWKGYVKYAFGENELKPISHTGHSAGVFGRTKMGATLVDSLDTLYIAGLHEEFEQAKQWVVNTFHIDEVNTDVSLFEFNIRFVGGFLSAYALSGDKVFVDKAKSVVDKLLPAFNTATGIPKSLVNLKTGSTKNFKWAASGSSILSEVGSLHLEFQYLTEITQDPVYLNKVIKIRNKLREMAKGDGLYSNYMNGDTGRWTQKHISLGALGDSFYEYLIKSWLITNKKDMDGLNMFTNAISALESHTMLKKKNGLVMVMDYKGGRGDGKMQHLACFTGGMFALASQHIRDNDQRAQHYFELAEGITGICHESYTKSPTHLGPEAFRIDSEGSVISRSNEKMYMLRPETVESYFYMWRLTHDPKYREWGWEMVQALEHHCRVEHGYSGIRDVYRIPAQKDDVQQSFFIAETLKYLYLLFSDDSVVSLDEWVFNTEAHPLPVLGGVPNVMGGASNDVHTSTSEKL